MLFPCSFSSRAIYSLFVSLSIRSRNGLWFLFPSRSDVLLNRNSSKVGVRHSQLDVLLQVCFHISLPSSPKCRFLILLPHAHSGYVVRKVVAVVSAILWICKSPCKFCLHRGLCIVVLILYCLHSLHCERVLIVYFGIL